MLSKLFPVELILEYIAFISIHLFYFILFAHLYNSIKKKKKNSEKKIDVSGKVQKPVWLM